MEEINDQEYRKQLTDLVKQASEMYMQGKYKNPNYGELCMTVVRLIQDSNFGRKEAESELSLKLDRDPYDEIMDGSFDGTTMQLLRISNQYLGRFGDVSMAPYSQGLGTRSAKVKFTPGDKK